MSIRLSNQVRANLAKLAEAGAAMVVETLAGTPAPADKPKPKRKKAKK